MAETKIREAWITHNGVRVFALDWTDATYEEEIASLERSRLMLAKETAKVLYLADVTRAGWGLKLLESIRKYMIVHKEKVGRFAVTGMPALYMPTVAMIRNLVNVPVPLYATKDEALRYLTRPPKRKGGA